MIHVASATSLYAAVLTVLFLVLSVRVVERRRAGGVAIGVSGDPALERAARVHANFAEYVPLALLLLLLVELSGYPLWLIHTVGVTLVAGRLVHAWGLSQTNEDHRLRVTGIAVTFTVLGFLALLLLAGFAMRGL